MPIIKNSSDYIIEIQEIVERKSKTRLNTATINFILNQLQSNIYKHIKQAHQINAQPYLILEPVTPLSKKAAKKYYQIVKPTNQLFLSKLRQIKYTKQHRKEPRNAFISNELRKKLNITEEG